MPQAKLDHAFAAAAVCEPGHKKTVYWDTGATCLGLILEVRETGKTWAYRFTDQHRIQRQFKIARFGDLTFDQVRKEARRIRSEVTLGRNPSAERTVARSVPPYGELAKMHREHVKPTQKSYATTEMIMRVHIEPRWGRTVVSEIKQRDIAKWLVAKREEGLAPASVEKIRVVFHRSFELALQWEISGVDKNPVRGVPRPTFNNARTRFLSADEAKRLQAAVAKSQNPLLPYIVGLLLLTGARVSELLTAEWKNVDVENRRWLIPMSKTGRSRWVPLSQAAVDVIGRVPRPKGSVYLFANAGTGLPITTIKHSWDTARRKAKLEDLHIHDLRHSAASNMVNAGIDLYAIGKVLGHANVASTQRYAHVADHRLMAAVEAGAAQSHVNW